MTIFTIGYAGIKLPQFIEVLKDNRITFLIDVRSTPRSQYFADFNDTKLKNVLSENNIKYENWKTKFGARQDNQNFYTNDIMDFQKFAQSKQFQSGIDEAKKLGQSGEIVCLMCAEIDPLNCHRAILCAKALNDSGIEISHIIAKRSGEITYEHHFDLEKRLLDLYKKQTGILQIAYQKHNQKIGFNNAKR